MKTKGLFLVIYNRYLEFKYNAVVAGKWIPTFISGFIKVVWKLGFEKLTFVSGQPSPFVQPCDVCGPILGRLFHRKEAMYNLFAGEVFVNFQQFYIFTYLYIIYNDIPTYIMKI